MDLDEKIGFKAISVFPCELGRIEGLQWWVVASRRTPEPVASRL